MFETIIGYLALPWVQTLLAFVIGWLAIPMPDKIADTWWGKLISQLIGNADAAKNLTEAIAVVMSILKLNGLLSVNEPAPSVKMVQRVAAGKLSLPAAANSHKAVRHAMMAQKDQGHAQ